MDDLLTSKPHDWPCRMVLTGMSLGQEIVAVDEETESENRFDEGRDRSVKISTWY